MKDESVLKRDWRDIPLYAIDIETSGQYPIADHICEVAAVKSVNGQIIDTYQQLIKPPVTMTDFVIGIHGITNEMVVQAPPISAVIAEFADFIKDGVAIAHHSPFDVGFLVVDYERAQVALPVQPFLCTSLLSRNTITGTANHRLATLVEHLKINGGQAHRALDDARACLQVALHCFERGNLRSIEAICKQQGATLWWSDFSLFLKRQANEIYENMLLAIEGRRELDLLYAGGAKRGTIRRVRPIGLVPNPSGDFLMAWDGGDKPKRYYCHKIVEAHPVF